MGLDWKKIREEYEKKATPKELDGPFNPDGTLKDSQIKKINASTKPSNHSTPVVPTATAGKKDRPSRAKKKPKSRQEAGAMAGRTTKIAPDVREHCAKLYGQGKTFAQIGRAAGVHPTTARKVLIEDGVHKPRESLGMLGRDQ